MRDLTILQQGLRKLLLILLMPFVMAIDGCGDGAPQWPAPVPFSGVGGRDEWTIVNQAQGFLAQHGYNFPCTDCKRVIAVAQNPDTAASAANATPIGGKGIPFYKALLSEVDFAISSVIVFDRAVWAPNITFTITGIDEYEDRLVINSSQCFNNSIMALDTSVDGFIVIPRTFKAIVFAPTRSTGLPPVIINLPANYPVGMCS